ncbi:MAG: glucosamine-6-phosphate deaminase [Bdellovibrionota bacterium]
MRIILSDSTQEAVTTVASMVLERISSHPNSVIGLATGKTMEPVYETWARLASENKTPHEKCFFFMLDEYLGLPGNHPGSFRAYIEKRVLSPLKLHADQFAFHPVQAGVLEAAAHYEQSLKEAGGVDLQLLGIGGNGHVGFNEPGSLKNSRTRLVELTPETIKANQNDFPAGDMPTRALSMGIGTILEAKALVMLATGKSKADAIKYLLNHHDDPSCPATFLKDHPNFTVVLDPDAASKINLKI